MRKVLLVILSLTFAALLMNATLNAEKPKFAFDHYYDNDAVIKTIKTLNKAYPELTSLTSLGKTEEGRDIWMLTINNPKTGSEADKPAVYADGAIHGNEIQATETVLYLAYYLLDRYNELPMIRELVDSRVFYIVPIVNVDGRAHFFTDPGGYNIGRTARIPHDDDNDGLVDEDDAEDINGDGEISQMRIKDPNGEYKTHPDDPRVMVRVKPGEKGEWTRLGTEGIDNDGDGRLNEDGPGYVDMNRNYGYIWRPYYVQSGSGEYPNSAKATKAIADFLVTKKNVSFVFNMHNTGGMILRGPSNNFSGFYPPQDLKVYDYLGKEGEKIVPGYRYVIAKEDLYTTYGDFDEFCYGNLGIYGMVGELYMSEKEAYTAPGKKSNENEEASWWGRVKDDEKQKFNDNVNQGAMWQDWKKFKHPQLGEIEIGGWKKFTTRMPPHFLLQEEVHRFASFIIFVARNTPEVEMRLVEKKDLGDGLTRIRVRLENRGAIGTLTYRAVAKNITRQDIVSISGDGLEVVSGGIIDDIHFNRVSYIEHRPHMIFTVVPGFGKVDLQWIVRGSGRATVKFDSLKATDRSLTLEL